MSKYVIDSSTLTSIADAVRTKGGTTDPIVVSDIPTAITNLPSGGGEGLTAEDLAFSGNCNYYLNGKLGTAVVNKFGNLITFTDVNTGEYFFSDNTADLDGITINLKNLVLKSYMRGYNGTKLPKQQGSLSNNNQYCQYFFSDMCYIREIPIHFYKNVDWGTYGFGMYYAFSNLNSLRTFPKEWLESLKLIEGNSSYNGYHGAFTQCYSMDELQEYPVNQQVQIKNNMFTGFCLRCGRLKDFTFKTNGDGTPFSASWSNQTIEFQDSIGYYYKNYFLNYNSGITADKEVKDDATYQALKNDPDWFTTKVEYSRYNHDSAVKTINSLPDTSAYLASAGGTNTIKFRGVQGALTDGGAINTLTEEEIAVAAAKGWTVTLV